MSLASPLPAAATRPDRAATAKPRKKLQKGGARPAKRSSTAAAEPPAAEHKGWRLRGPTKQPPPAAQHPQPPDLSDSKWLEYVRKSGHLVPLGTVPAATPRKEAPAEDADGAAGRHLVPEFAHLAVAGTQQQPRASPEPAGPRGSTDAAGVARRQAKTPVRKVGQLEGDALRDGRGGAHVLDRMSSVELIAEQYRALLASRNSMLFGSHLEPPRPSRQDGRSGAGAVDARSNSPDERPTTRAAAARARTRTSADGRGGQLPDSPGGSPASSDGTLVAFEEERVYFKPISFSPELGSPAPPEAAGQPPSPAYDHPTPPPPSDVSGGGGNLGLQICLDLLVGELSPALLERRRPGEAAAADVSSLQVWAMIEAYERLRDRVALMRSEDAGPLEAVFDTWLRALHALHDRMAGLSHGGGGSDSGSEYEVLERDDVV